MPPTIVMPPLTANPQGQPRRVGVEIEFHGLDPLPAAEIVRTLFGGEVRTVDEYRCDVENTRFGTFGVELDIVYAHPDKPSATGLGDKLKTKLAGITGGVASILLPREVCAPPVAIGDLPLIQDLVDALREAGGLGTSASAFYGFGMQLNVEIAEESAAYVLRHLRAYLLLSEWLRSEIKIDATRRLSPFVDPFPRRYCLKVIDPDYAPDLHGLIDDYLADNPTRNRELDMLPLFAHLDPDRIAEWVGGKSIKIKARPTFHYRLPDSRVDDPQWGGIAEEWNRWVRVEQLAADAHRLSEAGAEYRAGNSERSVSGWSEWIRALTN